MTMKNDEIKITVELNPDTDTSIEIIIKANTLNGINGQKSNLEIIATETEAKKTLPPSKIENSDVYKYLITLNIIDAANQVLELISKRSAMLSRNLSDTNKLIFYGLLVESIDLHPNDYEKFKEKLKVLFSKERNAAFQHIINAFLSVPMAINKHYTWGGDIGTKILCSGVNELYLGDQRFYKYTTKTRSEISKEGGIARNAHYLTPKQKACELVRTLKPQEGWSNDLEAFKTILPKFRSYLVENNIKRPMISNIEKTLRRWIKNDELFSAAVKTHSTLSIKDREK